MSLFEICFVGNSNLLMITRIKFETYVNIIIIKSKFQSIKAMFYNSFQDNARLSE